MAIDPTQLGLGALDSPPDPRDWSIDQLYAAAGIDPVAAPPASWLAPAPYPPYYNQGSSPMCVAYSNAESKVYQDLRDTGLFAPAFSLFFSQIGGTANGAVPRVALNQMLAVGYPPVSGSTSAHKIAAYYAVPVTQAAIQSAIMSFGPVLVSTPWYQSWFTPTSAGVLTPPDRVVGGHEILAVGWDARGLHLRNSWGSDWGLGGDCFLPWAFLGYVKEVWKSVDAVVPPPATKTYTLHIAARAKIRSYTLSPKGCLTGQKDQAWGAKGSSAPCSSPRVKSGCSSGQATVVHVPIGQGTFGGRWVRLSAGVTVTYR